MACGTLNASRMPSLALNAFMRHRSTATTKKFYRDSQQAASDVMGAVFVPNAAKTGKNMS
jgi:hypothetical protein